MTLWPVVSRKPKEEFERVGIERREVSLIAVDTQQFWAAR